MKWMEEELQKNQKGTCKEEYTIQTEGVKERINRYTTSSELDYREAFKEKLDDFERRGWIRRSKSLNPQNSFLVKKDESKSWIAVCFLEFSFNFN